MYHRAPFIWSSKAQVEPLAHWTVFFGGPKRREEGSNRWFLFRRRFTLPAAPDEASATLTVDGRYQLFVNGVRVGRGPVRCDPLYQRTDTHDIAAHLRAGENVLAMLVRVYGVDTSWYQRVEGEWQPTFGDGALYCDTQIRCGGNRVEVLSDEQWRCLETDAWVSDTPRSSWGLGFIEVHDARRLPPDWTQPGFDDSGWDGVQILFAGGGPPDSLMGGMRSEPFPTLVPREIPFLRESPVAPARVIRWYGAVADPSMPAERQLYEDRLTPLPEGAVEKPEALLADDDAATVVRTGDGAVSFLLDFGRIHSGYPFIEVEAQGGEVFDVAVAEGIPGEWDPAGIGEQPRLDIETGRGMHMFRYIARPGRQRFERFEWTAVRYAQVTVREAPQGVRIRHVGSTYVRYPVEERGEFSCSDAMLDRLWEISRYTLQNCMHDGWEDCPSREQRQWLGDATVEFLVSQAAFGPSANALNRQFLRHAAESQRPDGLTQMFAPGDHHRDAVLVPDWTLQWILNAEQHWLYTGEVDVIEAIFPSIQRALGWFERQMGPNGLVAHVPYWHFMDWAALGRHGEAAAFNAQLAGTFNAAARLAQALDWQRAADRYEEIAEGIAEAINARHWDERRGVYVDMVDPATGVQDLRVSQHANAAAILWGVALQSRWSRIVERITDPKRLKFTAAPPIAPTGDPFDPETDVVLANTFYSHFVYRALARAGRFDRALALMRDRFGAMLDQGATTLWESFGPTASLCHGFSATPLYQLSTEVLGIRPLEPAFRRFRFAPQFADLSEARGVFPTVRGDIRASWKRDATGAELEIEVPDGTLGEFVPPAGYTFAEGSATLVRGIRRLRVTKG